MDVRHALRRVFGGGADITLANPLPVTNVVGNPPYAYLCEDAEIPAGEIYIIPSGDAWGVLALVLGAGSELRIDGEVHCWGDVTGLGIITGEGELRLH